MILCSVCGSAPTNPPSYGEPRNCDCKRLSFDFSMDPTDFLIRFGSEPRLLVDFMDVVDGTVWLWNDTRHWTNLESETGVEAAVRELIGMSFVEEVMSS